MKRYLSALLAAVMLLSVTACGGSSTSVSEGTSAVTEESSVPAEPDAPKSNPVALDENGDIDMEVALAYQTDYEALKASLEAKTVDPDKPVSENASETTLEVFNYLRSVYGKQIISAQQMMDNDPAEDKVYYLATGDLPAMKGFDFIFATGSYLNDDMVDGAIEWHKNSGGLVTFTWHWNVPVDVDDHSKGYAFYQEQIVNWNQENAVTPGTKEYEQVIHDIDLIASKLQRLEGEGVTVLFRPLHEASGSWFWWGPQDRSYYEKEIFQKLWYMIYDRIENYHKLTNIIWVWNGQSGRNAVSPNSYDIAGIDYYADKKMHTSHIFQYESLAKADGYSGKMLALSECGYIPDPAKCKEDGAMWLYYMIWNGDFVYKTLPNGKPDVDLDGTPTPNEERLSVELLQEFFGNELMISHSDLPEFSTGTKDIPQKIKTWDFFREK